MTILSRLFLLVAVALLPAIAIQAYNEFDQRRARQVEVQNQALTLARLAAAEQQQIVQGIRQVLLALSELPSIKAKDTQGCNAYFSKIKQRYPGFTNFIVVDMDASPFCEASSDQKPMTAAGRSYFDHVLKTGEFTVGEFAIGRSSGRNVLHFALPFYGDDGRMGGVIIASLSLDWLADYLARKGIPEGAALAVTDRNGTYLARYPDNSRLVGRKIRGDKYLNLDDRGAVDILDINGVERIVGYSTLDADSGGLLVAYSVDKGQAFAEIQERTRRDVFLIVLSTALVLLLTSLGARRFIRRPLGELVSAANRWRLGEYSQRLNIQGKSEIAGVADAFNTMADALERREHELSEAKETAEDAAARIAMIFESTTDSVITVDRDFRISFFNEQAWAQIAEKRNLIGMDLRRGLSGRRRHGHHQPDSRSHVEPASGFVRGVLPQPQHLVRDQCVPLVRRPRDLLPGHHRAQARRRGAPPDRGTATSEPKNGVRRPAHRRRRARLQQPADGGLRKPRTHRNRGG